MVLRRAKAEDIAILTELSKAAFDTDVSVGGRENDGPPDYDSYQWHEEMMLKDHLFTYENNGKIIGGAVLFKYESNLYVGRIFISPKFLRHGFGRLLMQDVESCFPDVRKVNLDTPVWNVRTNHFYRKCGYVETGRDAESVYYEKVLTI